MTYYERNVPHWHPEGAAVFVTWRLHGTYAKFRLARERNHAERNVAALDRALDEAELGPQWLLDSRIAQCIADALQFGEKQLEYYALIAFVVMPNHVHVLLDPHVALSKITKAIKGFTARRANQLLERTGEPFWQDESYDHWVRNDRELQRPIAYIEGNPVSAQLVERADLWPWSSAYNKINTGKNACATR